MFIRHLCYCSSMRMDDSMNDDITRPIHFSDLLVFSVPAAAAGLEASCARCNFHEVIT